MNHRIRRQIIELDLDHAQGADAMQRRAVRVLQDKVLPELDRLFSRIAPGDFVLRLERLEVDLGDLDDRNWEQRFAERCVEYIARQVSDAVSAVSGPEAEPALKLDPVQNAWQILGFYLQRGVMPWYAQGMTLGEIVDLLRDDVYVLPVKLRRLLRESLPAQRRLAWQFSLDFTGPVTEQLLGLEAGWIHRAVQLRERQLGRSVRQEEGAMFLENLIAPAVDAIQNMQPEPAIVSRLFERASEPAHRQANPVAELAPPLQTHPGAASAAPGGGSAATENLIAETATRTLPAKERPSSRGNPVQEASGNFSDPENLPDAGTATGAKKPGENSGAAQRKPGPAIQEEGLWVENAGLVLLSPYLPAFFERLDIRFEALSLALEDGAVLADSGLLRALHLLHFLAAGEEAPEEPQLALPKLLCGIPIDCLILPGGGMEAPEHVLSETDKTEAEGLLAAVIQNWTILKSTSIQGLQNGFLKRSGQIRWLDGRHAWLLQVERHSMDILLDRLPWGYSVIKLPWMREMIQVEW